MRPLLPLNQNEALLRRALETAEETIRLMKLENDALKREIKMLKPEVKGALTYYREETTTTTDPPKEVWRDGW